MFGDTYSDTRVMAALTVWLKLKSSSWHGVAGVLGSSCEYESMSFMRFFVAIVASESASEFC